MDIESVANGRTALKQPKNSLLVGDVDGSRVTGAKVLTDRTSEAERKLREAGIRFTITISRPPRGLRVIVDALDLTTPFTFSLQ